MQSSLHITHHRLRTLYIPLPETRQDKVVLDAEQKLWYHRDDQSRAQVLVLVHHAHTLLWSHPHTHSLTHSLTHSRTHSLTRPLTHQTFPRQLVWLAEGSQALSEVEAHVLSFNKLVADWAKTEASVLAELSCQHVRARCRDGLGIDRWVN